MLGIVYIIVGILFFVAAIYHEQNFDNDIIPIVFIMVAAVDIGIGLRLFFKRFSKKDDK